MNAKQLIGSIILFSAVGAAFAEAPYPVETPFHSTKTHAQVLTELKQARAQGQMSIGDSNYPYEAPFHSTKTRAQALTELKQARVQQKSKSGIGHMYQGA
jgi:hypothetical protein